ncbi:MAG: DMT family transporter [Promethearchaeota archaeon]
MQTTRTILQPKHYISLFIVIIAWSLPPVLGRYLVSNNIDPLFLGFMRYLVASSALILLFSIFKRNLLKETSFLFRDRLYSLIVTAIFLDGLVVFLFLGVETATASVATILLNANGVFIFILSIFLLGEDYSRQKVCGSIFALVGSSIVIGAEFLELLRDQPNFFLGALLTLLAGFSFATYSVLSEILFPDYSPESALTAQLFMGSLILLPLVLFLEGFSVNYQFSDFLLIGILGLFSTALAFTLWFQVLRETELGRAASVQFLIPFLGVVEGIILLEEQLAVATVLGGFLTIIGVFLLVSPGT